MKTMKIVSTVIALGAALASFGAKADMVTDAHGNVGYDTAAECDAAVNNGSARFYTPFTHKSPLKRKGEARVQTATLKELGGQYASGACDVGVGRRGGREGVSTALQGKFIPFSPDMPVNVYTDKAGNAVRVTMAQCDNWFSGAAPRPVVMAAASAPMPQPTMPDTDTSVAPVVVPAVASAFAAKPYVFGTIGALNAGVDANYSTSGVTGVSNDDDTRFAGQVGFGVQFNKWLGAELFYTGSAKHKFDAKADISGLLAANPTVAAAGVNTVQNYVAETQQHTYGGRLTLGHNLTDKFRLFGKAGVAGTTMKITEVTGGDSSANATVNTVLNTVHSNVKGTLEDRKGSFARATAGVGATYNITDKLAVRGDYDHYFKRKYEHNGRDYIAKGKHYVGVGVQYNFR